MFQTTGVIIFTVFCINGVWLYVFSPEAFFVGWFHVDHTIVQNLFKRLIFPDVSNYFEEYTVTITIIVTIIIIIIITTIITFYYYYFFLSANNNNIIIITTITAIVIMTYYYHFRY